MVIALDSGPDILNPVLYDRLAVTAMDSNQTYLTLLYTVTKWLLHWTRDQEYLSLFYMAAR
jgi:hypothetical protein